MPKVVISHLETPGKGRPGEKVPVDVVAHVEERVPNPCVAIMYIDGPSDHVDVYMGSDRYTLPKSNQRAIAVYLPGERDRCTYVSPSKPLSIAFPEEGRYTIRFIAGYISDHTLFDEQHTDVPFTISGKPSKPPKPPHLPSASEVADYAVPALAGLVVGVATWKGSGNAVAGLAAGVGTALVVYGIKRVLGA